MRAVGPHSLARTGHAQVAADVSRRHLTNEPNAPTDGRVAQVPRELEGSARCRFPLLLWRRGAGRGVRRGAGRCWPRATRASPSRRGGVGGGARSPAPPRGGGERKGGGPPVVLRR